MNDRTRWEDARSEHGPDQDRYRQQGGWENSRRRDQAPAQGQNYGGQNYGGQNYGGQQGGFHDDERPQDWRGANPYRQDGSQQGWSDQPQQREWRGTDRPWGGTTAQPGGYGGSHADGTNDSPNETRQDVQRGSGWASGPGGHGYDSPDDIAGRRRDFAATRDNWRAPGSQSFASGYGMIDGPNYDRAAGGGAGYAANNPDAYGRGYGPDYGRDEGRGFLDRAGDTIASWFGSEEAARRREQDQRGGEADYRQQNYRGPNYQGPSYRGHGPSDYTRSDERIREDANDRLTDDHRIDARRISVAVAKGEITLSGTVANREAKRRAEDSVEGISGVRHVQNNLRVEQDTAHTSREAEAGKSGTATTGGTTGMATGTSVSGTGSTTTAKSSST